MGICPPPLSAAPSLEPKSDIIPRGAKPHIIHRSSHLPINYIHAVRGSSLRPTGWGKFHRRRLPSVCGLSENRVTLIDLNRLWFDHPMVTGGRGYLGLSAPRGVSEFGMVRFLPPINSMRPHPAEERRVVIGLLSTKALPRGNGYYRHHMRHCGVGRRWPVGEVVADSSNFF